MCVTGAAAGEIVGPGQRLIVGGNRKAAIDGVVLLDGADNLADFHRRLFFLRG